MPDTTDTLSLPYIMPAQAQKHVTHNEALRGLDALVQMTVLGTSEQTPPGAPQPGDSHIVASGGQSEWAGHDTEIAVFDGTAWVFYPPRIGWRCWNANAKQYLVFDGADWHEITPSALQDMTLLGLGTSATAQTPFQARLNQALWTAVNEADGGNGSMVATLNKEGATDDLGLVFQTNYATRALLGLFGSDSLRLSVTDDGINFRDVMTMDHVSGRPSLPNLPRFKAFTNYDNFVAEDVWTTIGINTVEYNDQNVFDPATNQFVAPADGTYMLGGVLMYKTHTSSTVRSRSRLLQNGVTEINGAFHENNSAHVSMRTTTKLQTLVSLSQGDTVELQGTARGDDLNFAAGHSSFWGYQVG